MPMRRRRFRVDKNQKNTVAERLQPIKDVVNRKGHCLFVIDEDGRVCGNPVNNNCHIIPESSVLSELKDRRSGKVFELQWGVNQWEHFFLATSETNPTTLDPDRFEPRPVGTGDACVRWFACKDHDAEFYPIDVMNLDFSDPVVPFLCFYRSTLYAADLLRMGTSATSDWDRKAMNHPRVEVRVEWRRNRNSMKEVLLKNQHIVTELGKVWYLKKAYRKFALDIVSGQLFTFRSRVRFAACVSYGGDVTVVVFPYEEDLHKMGVLHLAEDVDLVKKNKEQLARAVNASCKNSNYGVDVLKELLTKGSGAAAMSPDSYNGLSTEEKKAIRQLVARSSGQQAMSRAFGL